MTPDELLARWPECRHAVAWVELFVAPAADDQSGESGLEQLIAAKYSPPEALELIRGLMRDEIAEGSTGRHAEALAEIDHPSFLTYLAGRLGAY